MVGKESTWTEIDLKSGENTLADVKGELFDIDAAFTVGNGIEFGFVINGYTVSYKKDKNLLVCGENKAKLEPVDGKIQLRILVDRVSIEIFANNGRVYMPMRALPTGAAQGLQIFTKGGTTKVNSLKVREVKSIWNF